MAPTNKARAAGVGVTSFMDLKADLAEKEASIARAKAAGELTATVGGVQRPGKKPTVWARQNKGVKGRAARDVEIETISRATAESSRAALERKAQMYNRIQKGDFSGLSDAQIDALLVDFDAKADDPYQPDSDDEDESLNVPKPFTEDDPVIDYVDEFGRSRQAPRSEVPHHLLPRTMRTSDPEGDDDGIVLDNPANYFPVYEPTAERVAAIREAHAEENNPLNAHYDASQEVRAKGAGFFQFSGDEETRKKQMDELRSAREETEKKRQETGAADVKPGEVEGMQEGGGELRSRAQEKRKRELEERRKLVDAKRKKVKGAGATDVPAAFPTSATKDPSPDLAKQTPPVKEKVRPETVNEADAFLAALERDMAKHAK
ncbi:hypothetical protein BV25DRAFT_1869048 [Artomyces pyxidatus]|uniref:Uncharacterized protein n=1 Tax=Artomyces pyxidatus TaxID=48021 RepID=A0ACB8T8D6_9AGAM|nr:hypothetical protein BV25DRAFT_1869048 [Artomyces pyxidatus]